MNVKRLPLYRDPDFQCAFFVIRVFMIAAAPLLLNISCGRLDGNRFNFTVVVVHTGAGVNNSALKLTRIHFKEAKSKSVSFSHFPDLTLTRVMNSTKYWHGVLFNEKIDKLVNVIEFGVTVRNNFGHGSFMTVISEYGNSFVIASEV